MSLPDNFPSIQMSCEQQVQNTFHKNDIFMAIPRGIPCFLWCTANLSNNTAVCVVISNNKYLFHFDIPLLIPFIENQGTIVGATKFGIDSMNDIEMNFFAIDDIYYYRGQHVTHMTWGEKLSLLKDVLSCKLFDNGQIKMMIGLPLISYSKKHFQLSMKTCPYDIEKYIYRNFHQSNISYVEIPSKEKQCKTFRIKASPLFDIYYLYELDDVHCHHVDPPTLNIPNYKTSVQMNALFRDIKENTNLDLLEESDEEEEFQETNDMNTYTDLEKVVEMECYYDEDLNKWTLLYKDNHQLST